MVVKAPKDMTYMDFVDEKNKIDDAISFIKGSGKIPLTPLFCGPNC